MHLSCCARADLPVDATVRPHLLGAPMDLCSAVFHPAVCWRGHPPLRSNNCSHHSIRRNVSSRARDLSVIAGFGRIGGLSHDSLFCVLRTLGNHPKLLQRLELQYPTHLVWEAAHVIPPAFLFAHIVFAVARASQSCK